MSYYINFIDPGNAGGSVPIPDTSYRGPNKPIQYGCRYCKATFLSDAERIQHEWEAHPTRNPLLLIDHIEISATRLKVRDISFFENIEFLYADQITINDEVVKETEVKQILTSSNKKFFKIELLNQQVSRSFELEVDIVDPNDIQAIDALFYEMLAGDDIKDELVNKFIDICEERYPNSTSYTDALVKYLQGIKAKDGSAIHITFEEHVTKLNQALDTLKWFKSDLARSIINLIEFNFNRFDTNQGAYQSPSLDFSLSFFNGNELPKVNLDLESSSVPIPVDWVTSLIINSILKEYDKLEYQEIEGLARSSKTTGFTAQDRAKLNFILYRKALAEGLSTEAKRLLKKLNHDEVFKDKLVVEN